jgi:hypothetical protein
VPVIRSDIVFASFWQKTVLGTQFSSIGGTNKSGSRIFP